MLPPPPEMQQEYSQPREKTISANNQKTTLRKNAEHVLQNKEKVRIVTGKLISHAINRKEKEKDRKLTK